MARFFLRRWQRLRSEEEFRNVIRHKLFCVKGFMRLYMAPNSTDGPRFGLSVSRNCGKAHIRNRLKRFGRETFRLCQHEIPADFDYVLIFTQKLSKTGTESKTALETVTFQEIQGSFLGMVRIITGKQMEL